MNQDVVTGDKSYDSRYGWKAAPQNIITVNTSTQSGEGEIQSKLNKAVPQANTVIHQLGRITSPKNLFILSLITWTLPTIKRIPMLWNH
jgi:hypothetical protein